MRCFDFDKISGRDRYELLTSSIVPRPIALISTINLKGVTNVAPFSFFTAVSSQPPCLVVSLTPQSDGTDKDTLINIKETEEFVVNSVQESLVEKTNHASKKFDYGISEFNQAGFTALPSQFIRPPRVRESFLQFECRLEKLVPVGEPGSLGSATLIIGRILALHADESVLTPSTTNFPGSALDAIIDFNKLSVVARLGQNYWGKSILPFELKRPT